MDFTRAKMRYFIPILSNRSRIGAVKSANTFSRSEAVADSFFSISLYFSGCSYLKLKFSSSVFILYNPKRLASGAYIYNVSPAILYCLFGSIEPNVRMLCRRSAILIRITRMSSLMVSSNFLKFSACAEALSPKIPPEILVNPSTICAIFGPKMFSISSTV